jgi:excisionase family DNA binding protein
MMPHPIPPKPAAISMADTVPAKTTSTSSSSSSGKAVLPRLLSVDAVAEQLGMCAKTIRRLIDRGELRAHRFGRAIRVSEDDLAVFIKMGRE